MPAAWHDLCMLGRSMHLPFGPVIQQPEEHAELPEVVPIEDLTAGALAAAAQEIAQEQEENATWPTATA